MKKSINYWSFPGGLEGKAEIPAVLAEAKHLGYEAVELAVGETGALSVNSTEADCRAIRDAAREQGVEIASLATGLYWQYSLSSSALPVRRTAMDYTARMLQLAKWLGTDALLVVPGAVHVFFDEKSEIVDYQECYRRAHQSLKQCLKVAEALKVFIALENVWNKFLLSPLEMRDFVDSLRSKYAGVYFDVGNVIVTGFPEQWIRILGRRIKRIHLKDFKWRFLGNVNENPGFANFAAGQVWGTQAAFCDLTAGDVNWPKVLAALKKIGYRGPLTAEMLPPGPGVLERTSAAMDKILGRAGGENAISV